MTSDKMAASAAASFDAFVGLDRAGRVTAWSAAAQVLFGLDEAAATGRSLSDLVGARPPELDDPGTGASQVGAEPLPIDIDLPAAGAGPVTIEAVVRRPDGTLVPVDIRIASPLEDEPVTACFVRDASERFAARRATVRARRAELAGELSGRWAHDMNGSVLGLIVAKLDDLEDAVRGNADAERWIAEAMTAAHERGPALTRAIQQTNNRGPEEPRKEDVCALVRDVETLLTKVVQRATVSLEIARGPLSASLGRAELTFALLALISEADRSMPGGGTLAVRVSLAAMPVDGSEAVSIEVLALGDGVAPWTPVDMDPARADDDGGAIGPLIAARFARAAGGTAAVETSGSATIVRILVPRLAGDAAEAVAQVATDHPAPDAGRRVRVLLLEDDPAVGPAIARWLRLHGYDPITTTTGPEAFELFLREKPDVVIADAITPGAYGGVELVRRVRALRPGFPVVVASGFVGGGDAELASLGVPLLDKPYRMEELARILAGFVAGLPDRRG